MMRTYKSLIFAFIAGTFLLKATSSYSQIATIEELRESAFHKYFFMGTVHQLLYENHDKAIQYYDSLLSTPEVLDSLGEKKFEAICQTKYRLAECHRWIGNFDLALEYFKDYSKCGDDLYAGNIGVADIYMKLDMLDSATKYLGLALKLDSTQADVHYGMGKIHFEQGNYTEAVLAFTRCISNGICDGINFCDAYFHRAYSNYHVGKFKEALKDINEHLKIESADFIAAGLKGKILYELGEFEESAKYYMYYLTKPHLDQEGVITNMIGLCNYNLFNENPDKIIYAQRAFDWFKKSADLGYFEGQFNLGRCYLLGEGTEVDKKTAYNLMLLAAQQGDESAQYFLGRLYGDDFDKDWYTETQEYWFQRSARRGHSKAQYYLALLYFNGEGIPINLKKAKFWMIEAKSSGLSEAEEAWKQMRFD